MMYLTLDQYLALTAFAITVFGYGVKVGVKVGLFIAYASKKSNESKEK